MSGTYRDITRRKSAFRDIRNTTECESVVSGKESHRRQPWLQILDDSRTLRKKPHVGIGSRLFLPGVTIHVRVWVSGEAYHGSQRFRRRARASNGNVRLDLSSTKKTPYILRALYLITRPRWWLFSDWGGYFISRYRCGICDVV